MWLGYREFQDLGSQSWIDWLALVLKQDPVYSLLFLQPQAQLLWMEKMSMCAWVQRDGWMDDERTPRSVKGHFT